MNISVTLYELAAADPSVRFSPHCWKIRYALAHKYIDADRVPWRFSEKDVISFSGQGFVPVLVHGDDVLSDSWRIANYLEEQYPDRPSLFGQEGRSLSKLINTWADSILLPKVARIILTDIHRNIDDADKDYFRKTREKRFGASLEEVSKNRPELIRDLLAALAPVRTTLESAPFISGDKPRFADYSVLSMFIWARCISGVVLLPQDDPIATWKDRLLAMFDNLGADAPVVTPEVREAVGYG